MLRASCTRRGDALRSGSDEVPARAFTRGDMVLGEPEEQSCPITKHQYGLGLAIGNRYYVKSRTITTRAALLKKQQKDGKT